MVLWAHLRSRDRVSPELRGTATNRRHIPRARRQLSLMPPPGACVRGTEGAGRRLAAQEDAARRGLAAHRRSAAVTVQPPRRNACTTKRPRPPAPPMTRARCMAAQVGLADSGFPRQSGSGPCSGRRLRAIQPLYGYWGGRPLRLAPGSRDVLTSGSVSAVGARCSGYHDANFDSKEEGTGGGDQGEGTGSEGKAALNRVTRSVEPGMPLAAHRRNGRASGSIMPTLPPSRSIEPRPAHSGRGVDAAGTRSLRLVPEQGAKLRLALAVVGGEAAAGAEGVGDLEE